MHNSYYIFSSGELKKHDNTLQIIKQNGEKKSVPIERVYDLYIFGEISLSTHLINFLSKTGVCVHFFNYYDFYSGSFYPREKLVSGDLLVHQVLHYSDYAKRIILAKKFVEGASENILRNLRYYNARERDLKEEIESIENLKNSLENYNTAPEIMGVEGNIHRVYYKSWNKIINQEIDFEKRVKRPPDNMINSLISFLNSVLYTKVLSEIYKTQLNPTISYLHEPSTKRFSLSLDVAEIFKPLIVDRFIFYLLNKNIITENDFDKDTHYLRLKKNSLQEIITGLDKRLSTTLKHRELNRDVSYKHLIRLELYKIIKHLFENLANAIYIIYKSLYLKASFLMFNT